MQHRRTGEKKGNPACGMRVRRRGVVVKANYYTVERGQV